MTRLLKYMFITVLLLAAYGAAGQYSIDKVCAGAERYYRVTGEAGSTYTWQVTDPLGNVTVQASDRDTVAIVWNVIPGLYGLSVIQHAANGCDADLELGTVEVFDNPIAWAGNTISQCSGTPVTLTQATAGNYSGLLWTTSGDGTFNNDTILNPVYTPGSNDIINGNVVLTLTATGLGNPGSCPPAVSFVTIYLGDIVASVTSTPVSCYGIPDGTITITAVGGSAPYIFILDSDTNTTGYFSGLASAIYTWQIIDSLGCTATGETKVQSVAQIAAELQSTPADCFGTASGIITVTGLTGGSGRYEFSLDTINWQSSNVFPGLPAGTYNVFIRDSLVPGCMVPLGSITITEPAPLSASLLHTNATFAGANDGTITVINQSGGSGTYEYSLDSLNWQTSPLFTGLAPGTYTVYMRDAASQGCVITIGTVIILEGMLVTIDIRDVSCYGHSDGQAVAQVAGGVPPFTYLWNDPLNQATQTAVNLAAGIYTVIVTDSSGNTVSATDTVHQPAPVYPLFDIIGPLCQNSVPPALPAVSLNGIPGTWDPPVISTFVPGTGVYLFTPDTAACAEPVTLSIVVTDETVPTFLPIGPFCVNSVPLPLPLVSLEGITGSWDPDTISTSVTGITPYTFTPDSGQCAVPVVVNIEITNEVTPVFEFIGPLCVGSVPPSLPAVSLNGITGSWVPAVINTSVAGTYIFTFTPDTGQCAVVTTMGIMVTDEIVPVFAAIGPLCQYSTPPALPAVSLNGIKGAWNPATISTLLPGITTYTFTPDTGQCAVVALLDIVVNSEAAPVFAQIGPLCQNSTPPALPDTSLNNIVGTWNPATISTSVPGITSYTFTPAPGQCAVDTVIDIEVVIQLTPDLAVPGPFCQNSIPPALPDTSLNGIHGSWNPSVILTDIPGITTYTFTPDSTECAVTGTVEITVLAPEEPVFSPIGPLCFGSVPPSLPDTSLNGIPGTWSPLAINTGMAGSVTYTFTPEDGQCADTASLVVVVTDAIIPVFSPVGPLCVNSAAPALPDTSENGIAGEWNPAAISTTVPGIYTFTFTPDPDQCGVVATLQVEVTAFEVPVFGPVGPLCINSVPPSLPDTSLNGIRGTWSPDTISTALNGTTVYTFMPAGDECALGATLMVVVSSPEITGIDAHPSTNGLPNGFAIVQATGGTLPYEYSLNGFDWQTSDRLEDLVAGTYTAWVRDAAGCVDTMQFLIMNQVAGEIEIAAGEAESCISVPLEIPVVAYNFINVAEFTIQLTYDTSLLDYTGFTQLNNVLLNGLLTVQIVTPGVLQINFRAADSVSLLNDDLLFMINFQGMSAGQSLLQWNWLQCVIYAAAGYEIPTIYTQGAVIIRPLPQIITAGSGEYCEGTLHELNAESLTGQQLAYSWTGPPGTHNGSTWNLSPLTEAATGEYTVTATDSTGCANDEVLNLTVYPNPVVELAEYDTLCAEQVIELTAGPGYADYTWQDGSKEPTITVTDEGEYWVVVLDIHGCQGSDTVLLRPCNLFLWMPTAFTPNSDGLNDIFLPKHSLDLEISFKMLIFNKWGEQLFSSEDINKGWDGTYKGVMCPPDEYTWIINFSAPSGYRFVPKSPMTGTVMLVK